MELYVTSEAPLGEYGTSSICPPASRASHTATQPLQPGQPGGSAVNISRQASAFFSQLHIITTLHPPKLFGGDQSLGRPRRRWTRLQDIVNLFVSPNPHVSLFSTLGQRALTRQNTALGASASYSFAVDLQPAEPPP